MIGYLDGHVKLHCQEKKPDQQIPASSKIDLIKNISKKIEDKDSISALPRPKKNVSELISIKMIAFPDSRTHFTSNFCLNWDKELWVVLVKMFS